MNPQASNFSPGINVLLDEQAGLLEGRRVGLVAHRASASLNGIHSAQLLQRTLKRGLQCIFGPEHGFLGTAAAGAAVDDDRHPEWGIPIHSLYGETRKPTATMLEGLDVLVVDLQDLAVRCYTYASTLRLVMAAAAEHGIDVIVTDRPVPFPNVTDGPMLDPAFESFVGMIPAPLIYGMTPAETALFLKREIIPEVRLHTVPMKGWRRNTGWPETMPWTPPSPGIVSWETAMIYPSLVFCEALPMLDYGRGTENIFRIVAAPWLNARDLQKTIKPLAGLKTSVLKYTPRGGRYEATEIEGLRFSVSDPEKLRPAETGVRLLSAIQELHGPKKPWADPENRPEFFDKLMGTSTVRESLQRCIPAPQIIGAWKAGAARFEDIRKSILLY